MSFDVELFLLSWTQLSSALLLTPDNAAYRSALAEVERRLQSDFSITELQLVARSMSIYTIGYREGAEGKIMSFPADEVEDFS